MSDYLGTQSIHKWTTRIIAAGSICCLIFTVQVLFWAMDRRVPFQLLDYTIEPVKSGFSTAVFANVKRDTSRKCSVTYSRGFFDSRGMRFELSEGNHLMNPVALLALQQRAPNKLQFGFEVPAKASPGVGTISIALDYICNPVHTFYPVNFLVEMKMEVLP